MQEYRFKREAKIVTVFCYLHTGKEECENWSNWSSCTKKCNGKDTKSRSRSCFDEETGLGNDSTQRARCYSQECIEWSTWTEWSSCTTQRQRHCQLKGTNKIAKDCIGDNVQKERCNECTPVWTNWSSWGACSASCGSSSKQTRQRKCILKYTVYPSIKCVGEDTNVRSCTRPACPTWGSWSGWSSCSLTCGSSSARTRSRQCIFDGKPVASPLCPGSSSQAESCRKPGCPTWSNWGGWGACSVSCVSAGSGSINRSRNRRCVIAGTNTLTTGCPGSSTEVGACALLRGCPVWTSWGPWSPCSATCGLVGVTRTRHRQCILYGSNNVQTTGCTGDSSSSTPCSVLCKSSKLIQLLLKNNYII